jgi:hypothetical protein
MAEALRWVSRLTTVSLEMVLPGLGGLWLDRQVGTVILFTLLGFALGLTVGIWHLIRMTSAESSGDSANKRGDGSSEDRADEQSRGER